jgi:hypothetical protein
VGRRQDSYIGVGRLRGIHRILLDLHLYAVRSGDAAYLRAISRATVSAGARSNATLCVCEHPDLVDGISVQCVVCDCCQMR